MKNISLLVFAAIFSSGLMSGQSDEIRIKFIGNCGLYMTDGRLNVYVDFPYKSGAYNYMEYDIAQLDSIKDNSIFLFTHRHADHYSKKLVSRLKGKVYGPWKVPEKTRLDPDRLSDSIRYFSVQAFKTKHRFCFGHYSYLITWHNKKIFISGDTENADVIGQISGIDWAFVPSWFLIDAREKNMKPDVDKVALYHMYPKEKINVQTPDIILLQKQNEVISIPY